MPIWEDEETPAAAAPQSITQRVRAGNALPILSHAALFDLALFDHEAFTRYLRREDRLPLRRDPRRRPARQL